jgi:hypothetical protein
VPVTELLHEGEWYWPIQEVGPDCTEPGDSIEMLDSELALLFLPSRLNMYKPLLLLSPFSLNDRLSLSFERVCFDVEAGDVGALFEIGNSSGKFSSFGRDAESDFDLLSFNSMMDFSVTGV